MTVESWVTVSTYLLAEEVRRHRARDELVDEAARRDDDDGDVEDERGHYLPPKPPLELPPTPRRPPLELAP
jgi:hypothetical protein